MWKTLVVVFRFPFSVLICLLITFVVAPFLILLSALLFVWGLCWLPFAAGRAVLTDNRDAARNVADEVFSLPTDLLRIITRNYENWWSWMTGGPWAD
jgi:hypothetical protein